MICSGTQREYVFAPGGFGIRGSCLFAGCGYLGVMNEVFPDRDIGFPGGTMVAPEVEAHKTGNGPLWFWEDTEGHPRRTMRDIPLGKGERVCGLRCF